jgi:hypothetical protein
MYRIVGSDQKEYGPVTVDELRRWIVEGRLHANSLVRAEGSEIWKPLSTFPELAAMLPATPAPFSTASTLPVQQSNSMATTGLVVSSIALVCCGCGPLGVLGIVFSCIGLSQANRDPAQTGKGIAIAGIVLGIVSLVGSIVAFAMGAFGTLLEEIMKR